MENKNEAVNLHLAMNLHLVISAQEAKQSTKNIHEKYTHIKSKLNNTK